MGGMGGMGM